MQNELENLCEAAASFHARGYAFGSTGNLSVTDGERVWVTPTGASLRRLTVDRLAEIDMQGKPLNANKASKEYPFHLGRLPEFVFRRAGAGASAFHVDRGLILP
jgi:ribulose-5-phosphate 4-epimerase/fuculose-1-phosphate aldolase